MSKLLFIVGSVVTTLLTSSVLSIRVSETERIKNWHNNSKNTWPPTWQPERSQFTIKMNQREDELQMLPGSNERWENYMQYTQSRLLPRFTDVGFEVIDIPHDVFNKLRDHVQHEIDNNWDHIPHERLINGVYTPIASKFINMNEINWDVLRQLQTIHEEWAGTAIMMMIMIRIVMMMIMIIVVMMMIVMIIMMMIMIRIVMMIIVMMIMMMMILVVK